jgi:1-pyrroline-5-carboxylate dehydrogenase
MKTPLNEPVLSYAPNSTEKKALLQAIAEAKAVVKDIPMYIGNEEIRTEEKRKITMPHDHGHILGYYYVGDEYDVNQAIKAALNAREIWSKFSREERGRIFLKAADLAAGPYRMKLNAATMLGQSKNAYQAEIDAACELIDFFRFNVYFMEQMEHIQPESAPGVNNQLEYRPLEGFIFAVTPFNFTAIAANLPTAPAMLGNVVVWKPADNQIYAAQVIMELLIEAGLPAGVINLIYTDGPVAGNIIFKNPEFAGLHFTGSTKVFKQLWKDIADNLDIYKNFPRIVGETGGKDFVLAHPSADAKEVATALIRGAFEYQGQKCSAASRAYLPLSLWENIKLHMLDDLESIKVGTVEDFSNFMNAVIDERAFDRITNYIEEAKQDLLIKLIAGGSYDKSKGYFIQPTILQAIDPLSKTMREEIFGPVLSVYVYQDEAFEDVLKMVDETSPYALTGAVFSKDRSALEKAKDRLMHAAGNFYLNDKPTGAVVGQQPFGGGRMSGTNDKSGSILNLLRWVSPRTVKETFVSPKDYRYPFLG